VGNYPFKTENNMIDFNERIESLTTTLAELKSALLVNKDFDIQDILEARIKMTEENLMINTTLAGE